MRGYFIVVEGVDGVGKTTLARRLAERLRSCGVNVLEVREPGGTAVAEAARKIVLDPELDAGPVSELFLILAARADLVSRVIEPALAAGTVVMGDRYDLSTKAYQVSGRQLPAEDVAVANRLATDGLAPDLTIVLDAPNEVVRARQMAQGKSPDRIEMADADVLERIAQAFRGASGAGVVHLDAAAPADSLERAAWHHVSTVLGESVEVIDEG